MRTTASGRTQDARPDDPDLVLQRAVAAALDAGAAGRVADVAVFRGFDRLSRARAQRVTRVVAAAGHRTRPLTALGLVGDRHGRGAVTAQRGAVDVVVDASAVPRAEAQRIARALGAPLVVAATARPLNLSEAP